MSHLEDVFQMQTAQNITEKEGEDFFAMDDAEALLIERFRMLELLRKVELNDRDCRLITSSLHNLNNFIEMCKTT